VGRFASTAPLFFRADEKLAWRKDKAVSDWLAKGFRTAAYYLGRIRHFGDDLPDGLDWIVLMRFDLRKLVEHGLRQFALFEVEDAIISKQKPAACFLFGFLGVEVFRTLLHFINLSKYDDGRLLAFADVSTWVICLAEREPET